ncbi:MAG: hypothetical protein M0Q44_01415 [Methylobacter sp.]|jgi:hypothetical protein|nr:hypothetical protein [Methylobacter sp.]
MSFDFPSAQLPALTPLRNSFVRDEVEADLKQIFLNLFESQLAADVFDVNVLGMPHLGSLDLVRRSVNADGLVLFPGEREEAATRYVYRAWKARNMQGRGLFFLKTYLQLLYPGYWDVEQQMQDKALPYPTALYDRSTHGNDADKYLTSRLHIRLNVAGNINNVESIIPVISSILPARFVPKVSLIMHAETKLHVASVGRASMTLRATSTVDATAISFPDASTVVASYGNPSITLRCTSTVSR